MADKEDGYARDQATLPPGENPVLHEIPESKSDGAEPTSGIRNPGWLIQKARDMYTMSTSYLEANISPQWETNLSHFNNEHAPGSRFSAKTLKRSKVFRPKTRSMVRSQESALAVAAFGSENMLMVRAEDPDVMEQRISAQVTKAIMEYRLKKTMPWFLSALGAWQDTKNYGLCISHQYWAYEEDTDIEPELDETGTPVTDEAGNALGREKTIVRRDEPCIDIVSPDLFRFDPMCDWRDPANSSPYLIYMMPMTVGDALEKMEHIHQVTKKPVWEPHSMSAILATLRHDHDRTRRAREGNRRTDPNDQSAGNEFTTVWPHLNILRVNGEDYGFWTMGTELLLTAAAPLRKMYPHLRPGERPFVIGYSSLEAHKNYPAGDVELSAGLQEEVNTIANQRLDNVKLVLNKRYYVRRGAQVDLEALMRNVPGGGVMMNDPEKDVKTVETNDVTSSSYAEQDRLATEMDELVGSFSQSSVQSNKALGETVGGMSMVQQSAGAIQDYAIRVFMVTWMEPVLRQLVRLEHMYETDTVILALAAKKSELWTKYGVDKVTDEHLRQELTINVDVGIGNTDPVRRVERLIFGLSNTMSLPGMAERAKTGEIANEVFGSLGYKTADRFFMNDEEYAAHAEKNPPQPPLEIQLEQMRQQSKAEDTKLRHEREMKALAQAYELKIQELQTRSASDGDKIDSAEDIAAGNRQSNEKIATLKESSRVRELNMKTVAGSGI